MASAGAVSRQGITRPATWPSTVHAAIDSASPAKTAGTGPPADT